MKKLNLLNETYLREAYDVRQPLKDKLKTCDMLKREIENAKVNERVTINLTINVRRNKIGRSLSDAEIVGKPVTN